MLSTRLARTKALAATRTLAQTRARVVAALGAAVAALVVATATQAAALHSDVPRGSTGLYEVTSASGRQTMALASISQQGRPAFYTNGVLVGPTLDDANPQTVTAHYWLEYWAPGLKAWLPLQRQDESATFRAYVHGLSATYPTAVLPGHWFTDLPAQVRETSYRIRYSLEWREDVTGSEIGAVDIYADRDNYECAARLDSLCATFATNVTLS